MRKKINEIVYQTARYVEIAFSMLILITIVCMVVPVLHDLFQTPLLQMDTDRFREFLSSALTLVVGVEFVKMLCKHTAETLIEVLLFATARQMVVEHLATWETLIGVVAIAILFAVRKHLLLRPTSEEKRSDKL